MTITITKTRTRITERAGGTTAATMLQPNKTSQVKSNSQSGSHTSPLFTHHCIFARVFFYTYKLFVGCYCCCCFYNFRLVENKQRNRWTRTGWWCLGVVTEKHTMDREEGNKEKRKNTSSDRNTTVVARNTCCLATTTTTSTILWNVFRQTGDNIFPIRASL